MPKLPESTERPKAEQSEQEVAYNEYLKFAAQSGKKPLDRDAWQKMVAMPVQGRQIATIGVRG